MEQHSQSAVITTTEGSEQLGFWRTFTSRAELSQTRWPHIPAMDEAIRTWLEGKIDFQGQKLAERIQRDALIASTVVAFIAGYVSQSLSVSLTTFGGASAAVAVATVPAWPFLNSNPLPWLPVIKSEDEKK